MNDNTKELTLLHWLFIYDEELMVKELRTNDIWGVVVGYTLDEVQVAYNRIYDESNKETLEDNFYKFIENNIEYV